MKIRADFVTNSSSVSYIVSWSPEMAEFIHLKNKQFNGDIKKNRIYKLLTNDLKTTGQKIQFNDNTVYMKKYGFMKKTECLYDTSFEKPIDQIDFSKMEDNTLMAYIWGEYLVNARLSSEFKGFGSVQVPRDVEAFKQKFCNKIPCDDCGRKGTEKCFKVTNG